MLNNPTDDLDEEQIIKRVTLRGIDSELYDQFANHAKMRGISMGDIFTHLVQHATKKGRIHPFLFRGRFGIHHHHQKVPKIEFIENHESLTISKDDLISAGKETIFAFIRIKNLHFTKEVDSKTLLNYVLFIRCKNVTLEGDIPKLIEFGLIRRKRKYIGKNRELKDITIRNISKSEYHEFLALVKRQNKTVGEKINEELAQVVPNLEIQGILIHLGEPNALVVSDLNELNVTGHSLEELGHRKVLFYSIKNLQFDDDIPAFLFQEKVLGIFRCLEVSKPANVPRLIWLARLKE